MRGSRCHAVRCGPSCKRAFDNPRRGCCDEWVRGNVLIPDVRPQWLVLGVRIGPGTTFVHHGGLACASHLAPSCVSASRSVALLCRPTSAKWPWPLRASRLLARAAQISGLQRLTSLNGSGCQERAATAMT